MRKIFGVLFLAVLAMMLTLACEGPAGPAGPAGGIDTTTVYLGNNINSCACHTHSSNVAGWKGTAHYSAYMEDDACSPCHNTGWNTNVENGGYYENHAEALRGVQCEACHGPMGPNPSLTHQPLAEATLSGEACATCHATEYAEWLGTGHADTAATPADLIAEWGRSSCWGCHLTEGYLATWDATDYAAPRFADGMAHAVTCGTCHDAHDNHTSTMLRAQSTVTLPNPTGATITGWGTGLSCANCHRERRTPSQIDGQMTGGDAHFGPHLSTQANMIAGVGSYKIPGQTYTDTTAQHGVDDFPNMCVNCHVVKTGTAPHYTDRGHTFEPSVAQCAGCHTGATSFDIAGVQTEIQGLMDSLEAMILENQNLLGSMDSVGSVSRSTLAERQAAWAWFFVGNDGSRGIHNVDYARTLLTNSINHLNARRTLVGDLASIKAH